MIRQIFISILVALAGMFINAQSVQVMRVDNVVKRNDSVKNGNFYCNPLTLNAKPLDYISFSIVSRGRLAVVEGDPESKETTKIPFQIYLRRAGKIITEGESDSTRTIYDIEVATVLALAQPGDDLIIDPVRQSDCVAKRIIKVKAIHWPFPANWRFFSANGRNEGC